MPITAAISNVHLWLRYLKDGAARITSRARGRN